ncbi:hypothetical protein [Methanobacterium formicicum]|uniref:Uncharacterized protein n=1 Tax=Methanobacterium formicicum TaxID=2162 RepID=A0A843ATE7_METFO|nr:hypothetical protein [Methanobacterium formicicum]MBF4474514.1 hypothetical protein [Methanobacterium formicicum]
MKRLEISDKTYERIGAGSWMDDDTIITDLVDSKFALVMHYNIIQLFPELKTYNLHGELEKVIRERPWDKYENIDPITGTENILYAYEDEHEHGIDIGPEAYLIHENDLISDGKIMGWPLATVEELKRLSPWFGKIGR